MKRQTDVADLQQRSPLDGAHMDRTQNVFNNHKLIADIASHAPRPAECKV